MKSKIPNVAERNAAIVREENGSSEEIRLETLKDLYFADMEGLGFEPVVRVGAARKAAIKHARKIKQTMDEKKMHNFDDEMWMSQNWAVINWIKYFFGITDQELQ